MRILFLNALGSSMRQPLLDFLAREKSQTDIFCFQEAKDGEGLVGNEVLSDYQVFAAQEEPDEHTAYCLATYVHPTVGVIESKSVSHTDARTGLGLLVRVGSEGQTYTVLNVHGNPHVIQPADTKLDAPERLRQTDDFLQSVKSAEPDIIGGDFNLLPETESLEMFRRLGYRDLIREYNIETTRNHLVWDRFPNGPKYLFSDYVFVSPSLTVQSFSVPSIEVSDHLPMIVEVDLS